MSNNQSMQKIVVAIENHSHKMILGTFSSEEMAKKVLTEMERIPENHYTLHTQYLDNPYA